jgi:hypothetical protein
MRIVRTGGVRLQIRAEHVGFRHKSVHRVIQSFCHIAVAGVRNVCA